MKEKIPKALREQVWIARNGTKFYASCSTSWCKNTITVFDFHVGHNVPESKGGATRIDNLVPLCARCNTSMGNQHTFDEWNRMYATAYSYRSWCCYAGSPVEQPLVRRPPPSKRARAANNGYRVAPSEG